jgi:hypothetical protein
MVGELLDASRCVGQALEGRGDGGVQDPSVFLTDGFAYGGLRQGVPETVALGDSGLCDDQMEFARCSERLDRGIERRADACREHRSVEAVPQEGGALNERPRTGLEET